MTSLAVWHLSFQDALAWRLELASWVACKMPSHLRNFPSCTFLDLKAVLLHEAQLLVDHYEQSCSVLLCWLLLCIRSKSHRTKRSIYQGLKAVIFKNSSINDKLHECKPEQMLKWMSKLNVIVCTYFDDALAYGE